MSYDYLDSDSPLGLRDDEAPTGAAAAYLIVGVVIGIIGSCIIIAWRVA